MSGKPDFLKVGVPMIKAKRDAGPTSVGAIIVFDSRAVGRRTDGWIVCDGREFDPQLYPDLADVCTKRKRTLTDRLLRRPGSKTMAFGLNRVPDLLGRSL